MCHRWAQRARPEAGLIERVATFGFQTVNLYANERTFWVLEIKGEFDSWLWRQCSSFTADLRDQMIFTSIE